MSERPPHGAARCGSSAVAIGSATGREDANTADAACSRPRRDESSSCLRVPPRLTGPARFRKHSPRDNPCAPLRPLVRQVTDATDPVYLHRPLAKIIRVRKGRSFVPGGSGARFEASCAGVPPIPDSLQARIASNSSVIAVLRCSIVWAVYVSSADGANRGERAWPVLQTPTNRPPALRPTVPLRKRPQPVPEPSARERTSVSSRPAGVALDHEQGGAVGGPPIGYAFTAPAELDRRSLRSYRPRQPRVARHHRSQSRRASSRRREQATSRPQRPRRGRRAHDPCWSRAVERHRPYAVLLRNHRHPRARQQRTRGSCQPRRRSPHRARGARPARRHG